MTTHSALYVGDNTSLVELADTKDVDGTVQEDATVTLTALVDKRTGSTVTGVTLPVTMSHVADGLYRGILPHGLSIEAGRKYLATIKAVGSQGYRGEWVEELDARTRVA